MALHRSRFPDLGTALCLTDGGLETTLVFHEGVDLPAFAAFVMLDREGGPEILERYARSYAAIARARGAALLIDTPTWRASRDWGRRLGYDEAALEDVNRRAVDALVALRESLGEDQPPIVIGGSVGPRADGYVPSATMSAREAEEYHAAQIGTLAASPADFVSALTLNYVDEAIGIACAARRHEIPVVVSFTVETDGRLPTGQSLEEAIQAVDAASGSFPSYYMVNCAHPTHFRDVLAGGARWTERLGGLRVNASRASHAELDEAADLDDGDPAELAREMSELAGTLPGLRVFGGCCGTDERHIEAMAEALRARVGFPGRPASGSSTAQPSSRPGLSR